MNEKLFRETFSHLRASEESKEEVISMPENEAPKERRVKRPVLAVAVAAAVLCSLAVTGLAAGELISRWHRANDGTDLMTDGTDVGYIVPDETPEDMTDNDIRLPALRLMDSVSEEDGRIILRVRIYRATRTVLDVEEDITDALAESPDGTYSYYNEGAEDDTRWLFDFTVKPGWESEKAEEEGDGYGYLISGTRHADFDWQQVHENGDKFGSTGSVTMHEGEDDAWHDDAGIWTMASEEVPQTWSRG